MCIRDRRTGHQPSIFFQRWPKWDEAYTTSDSATVAVQINGKLRGTVTVKVDASEQEVMDAAMKNSEVVKHIEGKQIRKKVYVKNRILNLVMG